MTTFMPISQPKADELAAKLSASIFNNVSDFVKFYNSGMINKSFPEVKELVSEITATFKDVKERKGQLVFISEQEVLLDEVLRFLTPWTVIVKAKREISDALQAGIIKQDSVVLIDNSALLSLVNQEGNIAQFGQDKLFARIEDAATLISFSSFGTEQDERYNGFLFRVQDIAKIDDSFINKVYEDIPHIAS